MPRLLILIGALLMVVGLVVAWPLIRAAVSFRPVRGEVLDVIATPVESGRMRIAIAYEYPLPSRGERAIGYTLTDERLHPIDDPVVDAASAESLRALAGRPVRVYYDVNQPLDSAFMLSPVGATNGLRAEHGALMLMVGVALSILGQIGRLRRES
jgi:hypothetical protein